MLCVTEAGCNNSANSTAVHEGDDDEVEDVNLLVAPGVGEVLEVGTVYNNLDARPFAEYGVTPETNYSEIKLSNSHIKCFTTDQIYDNTRSD